MQQFISEKFTTLLDEIYDDLEEKPGRVVYVVPGAQIVWDDCCSGQLTGRLQSLSPVLASGTTSNKCGIQFWRATGEVILLRCALMINDQGIAPRPDQLTEEGIECLDDSDVLLAHIADQDWVTGITAWNPIGPSSGCRGISVSFTFNVDQPSLP